ncbi:MAG: hypothetical protein OXE99_08115 [Cellvibrionales bacterium]|nr:hypothetical protein [Cellvibrionales bacterium]
MNKEILAIKEQLDALVEVDEGTGEIVNKAIQYVNAKIAEIELATDIRLQALEAKLHHEVSVSMELLDAVRSDVKQSRPVDAESVIALLESDELLRESVFKACELAAGKRGYRFR